tara:strand:- start:594 stop:7502 length:6909 start_codon:yes stop_codon:yes gene_type:complete
MFQVITYSTLHLKNTALAIETLRAGSIALFDLEFCEEEKIEKAINNLKYTLSIIPKNGKIGIKSPFNKLAIYKDLVDLLIGHKSILVLSGLTNTQQKIQFPNYIENSDLQVWGEITSKTQEWLISDPKIKAVIIKGNESGGNIGDESSFVLSSYLIGGSKKDIFIQGGVSVHTASACFAAGASGVVIDDHLLAMNHSPLPIYSKKIIEKLAIEDTVINFYDHQKIRTINHPLFKNSKKIGWGDPSKKKWPVGQTIGFAKQIAHEYKTVGRFIKALKTNIYLNIRDAKKYQPLAPNSKLAISHGTRYPIVQGPMTRVSDVPNFINSIAKSGGLPFLALAMTSGDQVSKILQETKKELGDKPWGVGILGFISEKLRIHQFNEIKKVKPPFVLISGGNVAQVNDFKEIGISTYVHVPVPSLLKIFLDKGCRRFIFEGRECGGHVGPVGSFTLWESMINILLKLPKVETEQIHILFAGGIYNSVSSSMVAAISGPLAARGIKVGVLMGTAYLFTSEACESRAILPKFQQIALESNKTEIIEISPGHAIRCANTPFIKEFQTEKENGNKELEKLTLGRSRIASKGIKRDINGKLDKVSIQNQYNKGMFMLGEVAGMMSSLTSMEELHQEVSQQGSEFIKKIKFPIKKHNKVKPSKIAIVGISTILPKADSPNIFWTNIINKVNAITEIPKNRWDWKLYFDEDKKKQDKIYSKWGGFIDDVVFDPLKFGLPPNSLKSISPAQMLLLEAVDRALLDAGYEEGGFDNEHTSVIVGSDGMSALKTHYTVRSISPLVVDLLTTEDMDRLPEWNEESFPGILTNVLAGRISNRFNLGGSNFTVDSACASSLTAIDIAIKELEHGNSNMVIVAGSDIAQSPFSYTAFSKTQALSPSGKSQPFNEAADGIVISEGVAVVLLKRLEDAERDGDKIYCVVKGAASSSDGKGLGITAPRSEGQEKALHRAYRKAGYSSSSIGSYEAHGTGTVVGDKVELTSINNVLVNSSTAADSCAVGSVKSLIGHTKTSAGIVGLIKSALSLRYQTLAPHPMNGNPIDLLADNKSPVYLLKNARPWFKNPSHPRRVGISAFGFGGTNTHVTIEEYTNTVKEQTLGNEDWPSELFVFESTTKQELIETVNNWLTALKVGLNTTLKDLSFISFNDTKDKKNSKIKLAIVAENKNNLTDHFKKVLKKLSDDFDLLLPPQISLNLNSKKITGKLGFIFPGQGSQYPNMALENTLYIKELRNVIELANTNLKGNVKMDKLIFPKASFSRETTDCFKNKLTATENAQPAIGTISMGYFNFLKSLHIKPEALAGHSYGEFTALYAAGVIDADDFLSISEKRGEIMAKGCEVDGTMVVVLGNKEQVSPYLDNMVQMANLNSPNQTVISGERNAVYQVMTKIKKSGLKVKELEVSGPFHTSFFKTAQEPLTKAIKNLSFTKPKTPIYSNVTAKKYPRDLNKILTLLNQHLLSPVLFLNEINQMYQDGVRFFLEVGPNKVLTGLVNEILRGKEYKAIAVEGQGGGIKGILSAVGSIYTEGYTVNIESLYENRNCKFLTLNEAINKSLKKSLSNSTVLLNGGGVRKLEEDKIISGKLELINASKRNDIKSIELLKSSNNSQQISDNDMILEGYQSYQKTMQEFLVSQETMMEHFLKGKKIPGFHQQKNEVLITSCSTDVNKTTLKNSELTTNELNEVSSKATNFKKSFGRPEIKKIMISTISEITGYPENMLNEDIDLEAELGVNSIKRMEVLDKVLRELSPEHEDKLQADMSRLMRAKTVNDFLNIVYDKESTQDINLVAVTTKSNKKIDTETVQNNQICARYVMKSVVQELPFMGDPIFKGIHLITSDSGNVAKLVAKKIKLFGGTPIILDEQLLASFSLLEDKLSYLFKKHAKISSVIHCAPLSKITMPKELKKWKYLTQIQSKSLFQILRFAALKDHNLVKFPIKKIITTSSFGGYFGRRARSSNGLPSSGGNSGLLKSLNKERKGFDIKILDFDNLLLESEIAYRIVRELQDDSKKIEVGYPRGERIVFHPVTSEFDDKDQIEKYKLNEKSIVLATGGAKGITAEISKSMMAPGMKLIVVGRSQEIDLETKPEGGSNKSFKQLIDEGVEIEYYSVNTKDEPSFKILIEKIYNTYGKIDAVIHGAGIIDDNHIEQKDVNSFNDVFDTKVDTAFLLFKYLRPESLKLLVFFGSVSGRFGNQGQTDYAAANEVLNRFAWYIHQKWKNTRTLTINWGPWKTIGMASPLVIRLLKSQGMEAIEPDEGCNFFLREIRQGNNETSEVIAGSGPWGNFDQVIVPELELEDIFNQTAIYNI